MGSLTALAEIGRGADERLYPREALEGCDDALILFAAGFLGQQDGYWIAMAGMVATCVDVRPDLLKRMRDLYPTDWEFVEADAYEYAERADRMWDVLSVDCPSNHFDRCALQVGLWCSLARSVVVLGTTPRAPLHVPEGWRVTEMRFRSPNFGGTYWAVLERA